jgi:hypothetical protein
LHSKPRTSTIKSTPSNLSTELQAFVPLLDAQPPEVQEAFQFLLATAMHEAGGFELLNLAGGFPAKHTLLVTAIPSYQKTSHPNLNHETHPSLRQAQYKRRAQGKRKATKGANRFPGLCFLHALHDHSPDGKKLA